MSDTDSDIENTQAYDLDIQALENQLNQINLNENNNNFNYSNSNNLNTNNSNMTTISVLDLIKLTDPFEGTPGTLNRFIRNVDRILHGQQQAEMLTDLIRSKIKGKANEMLISVGDPSDWTTIKSHLQTQFSDRRTQETILHKLNTICQAGKTLETYYAEIADLQTALLNSIDHDKSNEYKLGQTEVYLNIVLKSFIAGLDSNLGYIIRANKPTNIKEAYDICLNEISMQNSSRDRNRLANNFKQPIQKQKINYQPMHQPMHQLVPRQPIINPHMYQSRPQLQLQPPKLNPFQSQNHYRPIQYNRPTFAQTQPQYPRPQPQFQPQQQGTFQKPTPMDTSGNSRQTLNRPNNLFKPSGPPNFKSKELFNVDVSHQEYDEPPHDYDYQDYDHSYYDLVQPDEHVELIDSNEVENGNFQEQALKPPNY